MNVFFFFFLIFVGAGRESERAVFDFFMMDTHKKKLNKIKTVLYKCSRENKTNKNKKKKTVANIRAYLTLSRMFFFFQ